MKKFPRRLLRRYASAFDYIDVRFCAAIADRRFVRVHFDDRVIHAHRRQRRQHVLDRMHAHRSFADRCRPLDRFEIVDLCINCRLVRQILALEFDSVIGGRRMQPQRNFLAGVQRGPTETGRFHQRVLKFRHGSHDA